MSFHSLENRPYRVWTPLSHLKALGWDNLGENHALLAISPTQAASPLSSTFPIYKINDTSLPDSVEKQTR